MTVSEWKEDFKSFINELQILRDDYKDIMAYIDECPVKDINLPDNGWVSVKDRLPDDASDVLAYYSFLDESRIVPVNYYKGVWYDCVFNRPVDDLDQRYITHWMPLPEPPTE